MWRYLAFILLVLASCSEIEQEGSLLPPEDDDGVKMESFGVEFTFSDSARVKVRLNAGHVTEKNEGKDKKPDIVHYLDDNVRVDFLSRYGAVVSKITCNNAKMRKEKGLAELEGKVVAVNYDKEKLETEKLFWNRKTDKIYTDEAVRIQTKDKIITGNGFESNSEFTDYTIYNITGTFEVGNEMIE